MIKGTVKWFNSQKGHGLITLESGNDIYVRHSVGFKGLAEGQKVEFEIAKSPKGKQAINVLKI